MIEEKNICDDIVYIITNILSAVCGNLCAVKAINYLPKHKATGYHWICHFKKQPSSSYLVTL